MSNYFEFIGSTQKIVIDRNIERAKLARVWLHKAHSTKDSQDSWDVLDREESEAITKYLLDDGLIADEEWMFSYIEPMCIEHGVLHIYVGTESGSNRVLCIDPESGRVEIVPIGV